MYLVCVSFLCLICVSALVCASIESVYPVVYRCLPPSVYVGCIIGCSRPDSARGVHQAVTRRDREESSVAVRRPF